MPDLFMPNNNPLPSTANILIILRPIAAITAGINGITEYLVFIKISVSVP